MTNSIPVVNLADFTEGNESSRKKFVADLGKAYSEIGFVAVVNHGISNAIISKLYEEAKRFFSFDDATKRKFEIEGLAGQRGYTSFGKEKAKQSIVADLKEFYQFGQTVQDGDAIKSEYPDNVVDSELEQMNKAFFEAYRAFEKSGSALLKAIALFLELDENYFETHIHNGNSILRAIHYPPILNEPASAIRAEQHEDINLITLLVGASADGLEVLRHDGEWLAVRSSPDQIVVNVGDMLQRLTNNKLKSTTHRVVNPPRELWHTSRFSMPFFLHPRSEMSLNCLTSCITENNPIQYEPTTAGKYLDERLIEIGLKK
jgi:isopenicillin N synthase-like dioxygenase